MTRKEKIILVFLILLIIALPLFFYLLLKRQFIGRQAIGCSASFAENFLPSAKWQKIAENHYQVLKEASGDNQVKINWQCSGNILFFTVKNNGSDISTSCWSDKVVGTEELQCTEAYGCAPSSLTSGFVTCKNLSEGIYNLSLVFTP